ncbi:FAD-dependent monooxygenase [Gulosibacter chungangensis]|uniref:3-hydroxybenzoate 4-monooxygenase n=1 Tax=Gulosibacter chungangensis TaxID=979746 RepID=A0A7J5BBZ4_9MICO|nr:FAD-dependent monooxygenase [Gulosibacter chungangensis]KAB1643652.1 3-hydroxybenzoate 4-monooxygenase [Gulosibacter chungangensis]
MQFHHHGYVPHDPRIKEARGTGIDRTEALPDEMDVLIVGAGPAGIVQAAQLTNYPEVHTRIIDSRPGRLEVGRADGLFSRSSETFQAFEFQERIAAEANHLREMNFWGPNPDDPTQIARGIRAADPPAHVSEFPILVVNQARVIDYFAEYAANGPAKISPNYGYEFIDLERIDGEDYPVKVRLKDFEGNERIVSAKYVVGCDGARSKVRDAVGIEVNSDPAAHAWAVMDILAETDFPDIRTKCGIQSDKEGTILLIPREGGFLFRFYVSLGDVDETNRAKIRATEVSEAIDRANRILHPYSIDVRDVAWYSVYEVRHRVAQRFDDVPLAEMGTREPRVFIAGDACHTHSAKAGQGMNVSIQDGWNLSWKLGQVLTGRSDTSLLSTYSAERQVIAQNLIDFDKEWSAMMSRRPEEFSSPSEIGDFYVDTAEFPGGFATRYLESTLIGDTANQALAKGFPVGKRFKSARASRIADTTPRHLGHHFRADGRWRLYAFADTDGKEVAELAEWLEHSENSPIARFTPIAADIDAVFDAKVIYQQPYQDVDINTVPRLFRPRVGPFEVTDYEKMYAAIPGEDIFEERGIDRSRGALVIVRPDMYVAQVLPLTAREEISEFFAQTMIENEQPWRQSLSYREVESVKV